MVDDELNDDGAESTPLDGPRRSTFTPPPSGMTYDPAETDDDALASALAQQLPRSTPVRSPEPDRAPGETLDFERTVRPEPTVESNAVFDPQPAPPGSIPPPPQRQSLSDAELMAAADLDAPDHDTSSLLDLFERELQLRQEEAARLAAWEQQVRQSAGPEAEQIVTEVRSQFTGVIPVVAASTAPPSSPAVVDAPPPPPPPPVGIVPPTLQAEPAPTPPVAESVAPTTGPELDLALADAPPPLGAAVTAVPPPPGSVPAPPDLVEPTMPDGTAMVVSAPTAFEALLAAADAATGETPTALTTDEPPTDPPWRMEAPRDESMSSSTALHDAERDSAASDDSGHDSETDDGDAVAPVAAPRPPRIEASALEPTPAEHRTGRSVRLFWLWFAVNSSVVSVALGAVLLGLGMSLRQSVLAALIGVAISFLPLGLGTLASKWSGQQTMVVSRATFGTSGNVLPALLAVITRQVWAATLLWLLGIGVAEVLVGSSLLGDTPAFGLALVVSTVGLVVCAVFAGLGFRAISVLSAVVTALGVVFVGGLIALTLPYVDLSAALSVPDGPWILLASGAVLVFSVVGLAWANSSGDVARYQAKATHGSAAVLWTAFGATIPSFALISWGALLAASNPFVAEGLTTNPVDIISRMLPLWYPVPLVLAVGLGLIAAATLALYSGGFALLAVGIRSSRAVSVLIVVIVVGAVTAGLALLVVDITTIFRDVVTTLAVPVAAWAGIFGAETMIRTRRVHSSSLLRRGGVYPRVRWVNTVMLLLITAVGWGLTTATLAGFQWQGYLWPLIGVPLDDRLAAADLGVAVALVLGLLTPIVAGIPALRKLQSAEREASVLDGSETATTSTPVQASVQLTPGDAGEALTAPEPTRTSPPTVP